jgi:transcriptional regulator GlxA family with amidase domain
VLLFYPRPLAHRFQTDPDTGAEMACATIAFGGGDANPIPRALPACMQVPLPDGSRLATTAGLLFDEAFDAQCGRQLVVDRLFEVLLVQLLRHALAEGSTQGGLLAGLSHPRLRHALVAMHDAPQRAWTIDSLAAVAGMSRTRFAAAFRETLGTTPADYLAGWRVAVAQDLLRRDRPLKQVAAEVGYESPVALTRAFKARTGVTPREWKRAPA